MKWLVLIALILLGCDTVKIEERVIYEDKSAVIGASVHQWTDEGYNGYATTDNNGEWSLHVPSDTIIYLCVDDGNILACYECGTLTTPSLDSNVTSMISSGCDDLEHVGD